MSTPTWTARVRESAVSTLPPEKLLADRQPAYVASWIYVFGILSLSAFALCLVSGAVIALAIWLPFPHGEEDE